MKIAVILGSFSVGHRPLDFANIFTSSRGLTGTDLCFIRISQELAAKHEVHMYSVFTNPGPSTMSLHSVEEIKNIDDTFDAIISINEPNLLIGLPKRPFKMVYMMLNDFAFTPQTFDDHIDLYVGVCEQQANCVAQGRSEVFTWTNTVGKWKVVPLGCDPDQYEDKRVKGRVIWCSSADRGLHWLLQMWPDIKKEVPEATLRVLYHFNYDGVKDVEPHSISPQGGPYHPHIQELAQRVRYIADAIPKLKKLGVEHVGSVSREQMVKEWNEASVFGFSCDTVAFSEGFSVSTLEAHASFTLPVITDVDCLGGIYKDSGAIIVPSPIKNALEQYKNEIIYALSGKYEERIKQCREFAQRHTWKQTSDKLEQLILENK